MKKIKDNKLFREKSIFYSWLFSYVIIILIPILSSIIIFIYNNNIVDKQLLVHSETLSRFVMDEYDAIVTENLKASSIIASDDITKELFAIDLPLTPEERLRLHLNYSIVQPYYTQFYNSSSKTSIYFYLENCDYIIGDRQYNPFIMEPRDAFLSMYGSDALYEDWMAALHHDSEPTYLQIGNNILYIMPYKPDGQYKGAFVIARENAATSEFIFSSASSPLSMEYAVFNSDENCIYSTSMLSSVSSEQLHLYAGRSDTIRLNGKRYMLHLNTSSKTGLSYIVGVSNSDSEQLLKTLRLIETLMIIIPIAICFYLVWFVTKRNYIPLEQVLQEIRPFAPKKAAYTANGFDLLKNIVSSIVTENIEMNERFTRYSSELRNNMLHELLIGRTDYAAPTDELLESYDIRFIGDKFAVVVFHIESYEALFTDSENISESSKLNMVQFIFTNAFEELANKEHSGYMINAGGKPVLIVSFSDENSADAEEWLYETVSYLKTFIAENFSVYFTAAISNIHKYTHGIAVAYSEVLKALDYKSVMESNTIITQKSLESTNINTGTYAYSYNTEQLLANYITTADYDSAKTLVYKLLDSASSADMRRCLVFNLCSTVIKLLETSGLEDYSQDIDNLIKFETIDDVKGTLLLVIQKLCESKKEQKGNRLNARVKALVEKEYANPELNIGYISDALGLHHVYLSSAFKSYSGEGLLDYINKIRIEHSLPLLADLGLSVEEVSEKVGYSTSKTFIRTFKKIKGVTPAKYREYNIGK